VTEADLEEEGKRKHVFDMERIEPGAYFVYEVMIEMIHQGKVFEVELSSYDEKETTANRAKLLMMLQASRQAKGGDGDYQVLHSWIDTVVHGEDGFLSLELDDDDEIETFLDQSQIARFLFADPEGRSEEEYEGPEAFMLVHRMVGCDEGSLCYDTVVVPPRNAPSISTVILGKIYSALRSSHRSSVNRREMWTGSIGLKELRLRTG